MRFAHLSVAWVQVVSGVHNGSIMHVALDDSVACKVYPMAKIHMCACSCVRVPGVFERPWPLYFSD